MRRIVCAVLAAAGLAALAGAAAAQQMITDPMLPENASAPVSPHVRVIMGFPNIGIVVGRTATLVVDTGMGPRNGAVVAREGRRVSPPGNTLYLTTTHFHPEHASGQDGFPPGTVVIRPRAQQAELERDGARLMAVFSSRSEQIKALLQNVKVEPADVLFDDGYRLDLGGVHVRLMWFGPAHTEGDELILVEEDRTLLPGDVVQNKISPNVICDRCSPRKWLAVLDRVAPLRPEHIVPDHGGLGGVGLIAQERGFLQALQDRSMALKAQGKSADEAGRIITAEFMARYPDWQGLGNTPQSVKKAYADAP